MRALIVVLMLMSSSVAVAFESSGAPRGDLVDSLSLPELERGLDAVHAYYESERMLWGGTSVILGGSTALLGAMVWESSRGCTWLCFGGLGAGMAVTGALVTAGGVWKLAVPGHQERTLEVLRQGRRGVGYEERALYALQRIASEERGWRMARASAYGLGAGAMVGWSVLGGGPDLETGVLLGVGMSALALWNLGVASEPELVYESLVSGSGRGRALSLSPAMMRAPGSGHMHTGLSLSGRW